jgi:hypothetical protein
MVPKNNAPTPITTSAIRLICFIILICYVLLHKSIEALEAKKEKKNIWSWLGYLLLTKVMQNP